MSFASDRWRQVSGLHASDESTDDKLAAQSADCRIREERRNLRTRPPELIEHSLPTLSAENRNLTESTHDAERFDGTAKTAEIRVTPALKPPGDAAPPHNFMARSPPGQWRLLSAALVAWVATAWALHQPGRGDLITGLGIAAGGLLLIALAFLKHTRSVGRVAVARSALSLLALSCAALVLCGASLHMAERARGDSTLGIASSEGREITFEAVAAAFPDERESRFGIRRWVRVEAHTDSGAVPILLWLPDTGAPPKHWAPGTSFEVTARLTGQAHASSAAYTARVSDIREVHPPNQGALASLTKKAGNAAAQLRNLLIAHSAGVPGAELVPGFAVGDTSLVSDKLNDEMLESSLTHLTAVSGSNTGLVIAAVMWAVSWLGFGRRTRIVAGTCGLIAFITVVGPDASVQRAAVMATVLLAGRFGGKTASALPALGCAVLLLLTLDPWQSVQPGFALSVTATGGILLLGAPLTQWLHRKARLPMLLALPFAIAIAAQLACGPLLLLLQPGVPAIGVVANVIAAPAAPMGTGVGLLAALLGPISPDLATVTVQVASWPARWVAATAEVCAGIPGGRWNWPEGWPGAMLLAFCQMLILVAWGIFSGRLGIANLGRIEPRQPWERKPLAHQALTAVASALLSLAVALLLTIMFLTPIASFLQIPKGWAIVACDVGQGDAILLRDPNVPESVMLVDTGDNSEALLACLSTFQVDRISLLVLTHDDRDHVGALSSVLERTDSVLIAPSTASQQATGRELTRSLTAADIPFAEATAGAGGIGPHLHGAADSVHNSFIWTVLAPGSDTVPLTTNGASIVLSVEIRGHTAVLLGDTGQEQQAALRYRAEAWLQQADVVKVAHHGSRDQDLQLYADLAARWALLSVGTDNGYGHPNTQLLGALARSGSHPLRTDLQGHLALVVTDSGDLEPWVERGIRNEAGVAPEAQKVGGAS